MRQLRSWITMAMMTITALTYPALSSASVISVGAAAFGAGSTLTTFTGLANGTEVNNLTVDGLLFVYSLGNGHLIIDGGPGITNNVSPQNIVSIGNASGLLNILLPGSIDRLGYGYIKLGKPQG